MASLDVRDMLDLPSSAGPRPAKKQKNSGLRPNLKGLQREVQSLGGDNPIAIVPEIPSFKKRRLLNRKPTAHWELRPFSNSARDDGLILRHWGRKADVRRFTDGAQAAVDGESQQTKEEEETEDSLFAKFNVKVNLPQYNDEQYEVHLNSDVWSREETDYLMGVVQEFDLRWPIVWDRYDYHPGASSSTETNGEQTTALVQEVKQRTLEDLKARYYEIAAKMLSVQRPVHLMNPTEFNQHQLMLSFNPKHEQMRKQFAENLISRSPEERKEEESLLIELKRILARSERLNEERKELYARLEAPPSTSNIGLYTTSQGLQTLVQQLMNADKNKKRKTLLAPESGTPTSASGAQQGGGATDRRDSNRESISAAPGAAAKKTATPPGPPDRRKLTEEEEIIYGVSHHERLSGGPIFRHDRITRQISNKSAVVSQKITNTLAELEIPLRMTMATAQTTALYEQLLASINMLLDTKKVADKLDQEIKLAEAQKAEREKKKQEENGATLKQDGEDAQKAAGEPKDTEVDTEVKAEDGATSGGGHKRSASVLSQASDKSTKRQKR